MYSRVTLSSLDTELSLAGEVCDCPQIREALESRGHPCRRVVATQGLSAESRQRPEPWFGALGTARVLFISSNPSINEAEDKTGEIFPTSAWDRDDAARFFVNRISDSSDTWVTFKHPTEPDFLTKCHDGEFRSGVNNPKQPQPTWRNTHIRAQELLGEMASPLTDYAITEVVHCKSRMGEGVDSAAKHCSELWMPRLLALTEAPVVILLGRHVRDNFALPILRAPSNFGRGEGYSSLTPMERCIRDTFVSAYGGRKRVFIFNWHPTAMKLRTLTKVYGSESVRFLGRISLGQVPVPASSAELHSQFAKVAN